MQNFSPRVRIEVYVPIRHESAYQEILAWLIQEFTYLQGGCSVVENVSGYYFSNDSEIIDDRINLVYCDFPLNWDLEVEREQVLNYCRNLQSFLLDNLSEEAILISVYSVHTSLS